jgi:phosphoglycolate phosphatase-like HAD superfamily hydrolase
MGILGKEPSPKSFYVGDSLGDAAAAAAAGMRFAWAAYGYGTKPETAHVALSEFAKVLCL